MALEPTPARERLVAHVTGAIERAAARKLKPTSVYLTDADARACGLLLAGMKARKNWTVRAGDPPRALGLPIRLVTGKGRSRLYCHHGIAISFAPMAQKGGK